MQYTASVFREYNETKSIKVQHTSVEYEWRGHTLGLGGEFDLARLLVPVREAMQVILLVFAEAQPQINLQLRLNGPAGLARSFLAWQLEIYTFF